MAAETLCLGLLILLIFIIAPMAIKIVREYERLVIFRFGRCVGERGPGLVFLIPFVEVAVKVDLREQYLEIPRQTCITKDNAPIDVDFLVYWRVVNAVDSVIQVRNFAGASQGIATTTLRAVIGDIQLDDVLARREEINRILRTKLDEVTERWGVKVTSVEIREILPPKDVQEAMIRQLSAERTRRAMVTEADGKRESAIKVAEGEKQAAILKAEGQRQALILTAEGERQASILKAEGFALALQKIFDVARTVDSKTMSLQYLEALKSLGQSPATKFIFPMEFSSLLRPFVQFAGESMSGGEKSSSEKA